MALKSLNCSLYIYQCPQRQAVQGVYNAAEGFRSKGTAEVLCMTAPGSPLILSCNDTHLV